MTVLESIFLGYLQGFTEFLPVSSSGHLLLAEKLFNIQGGLFFDVMLHLGTLIAVIISMRHTLWQTIRHPVADRRFVYLVVASIPTFAIALLVKRLVPTTLPQTLPSAAAYERERLAARNYYGYNAGYCRISRIVAQRKHYFHNETFWNKRKRRCGIFLFAVHSRYCGERGRRRLRSVYNRYNSTVVLYCNRYCRGVFVGTGVRLYGYARSQNKKLDMVCRVPYNSADCVADYPVNIVRFAAQSLSTQSSAV